VGALLAGEHRAFVGYHRRAGPGSKPVQTIFQDPGDRLTLAESVASCTFTNAAPMFPVRSESFNCICMLPRYSSCGHVGSHHVVGSERAEEFDMIRGQARLRWLYLLDLEAIFARLPRRRDPSSIPHNRHHSWLSEVGKNRHDWPVGEVCTNTKSLTGSFGAGSRYANAGRIPDALPPR
jgi:hypothetical protein